MNVKKMTAKERVLASLRHQPTDMIPLSLGFGVNEPAQIQLQKHLGLKNLRQVRAYLLGYSDIRSVMPAYAGPKDRHAILKDGCSIDIWNIKRRPVSYGSGHYLEIEDYPLAGIHSFADLDQVMWPSPDWEASAAPSGKAHS